MDFLRTVTFGVGLTRNQPAQFTLQPATASGGTVDLSSVTSTKFVISHAIGRDEASEIVTYTDKFVVSGAELVAVFDHADIEALPLGVFPAECLVTEDGITWFVTHQGTITVNPCVYRG